MASIRYQTSGTGRWEATLKAGAPRRPNAAASKGMLQPVQQQIRWEIRRVAAHSSHCAFLY
ncbi:hypothetical protein PRIPAC_88221 [Pristionchus pacificus]|uniref:Uncharacterized protein n=1 Tax=Pristionchus pacificus TaxID=54126 RepID=A0A2A6B6X9_PRIPA|nr:hypothetical protein PRIPAC_88221 [Pristionchus pacificus]|eukprot:PDM61603.1 hypothetical protein PRIPAC_51045 [Pristionchus pacificus]